jgi:hypothetical protein
MIAKRRPPRLAASRAVQTPKLLSELGFPWPKNGASTFVFDMNCARAGKKD